MDELASKVVCALSGKTLAVAESCTGGSIGAAITSVPGSSNVFLGGIISYTNTVKSELLNVSADLLSTMGAVSSPVAEAMARGAKSALSSDIAVSVTGLAGPGGDQFGNPVGTVYIGYCDQNICISRKYIFDGDRNQVRTQATQNALQLILDQLK